MTLLHTLGNLCDDDNCLKCMMLDMDAFTASNNGKVFTAEQTAPVKTRSLAPGTRTGRGVVHRVTPRQVAFIKSLINTRDTTNLVLLPGQTINPNDVPNMGLLAGKAVIDKLLACPILTKSILHQGSPKQQAFLKSLMGQLNLSESDINKYNSISEAISALLEMKRTMPKAAVTLKEGLYAYGETLYRLSYTRSSKQLVAYRWEAFETPVETKKGLKYGEFTYEGKGPLNKLNDGMRVTREQAQAFGMKMHFCMMCGIQLTNKDSITRGIGPVCADKF